MSFITFFRRTSRSFSGHLAWWQAFWGVPMAVLFLHMNYVEGTLTFGWGLWCVVVSCATAILVGTGFWFTAFKPLILAKRKDRP